jgi:hypothetical protein
MEKNEKAVTTLQEAKNDIKTPWDSGDRLPFAQDSRVSFVDR